MNFADRMDSYGNVSRKGFHYPFTVVGAIICAALIILFFWQASFHSSRNESDQIKYQLKETAELESAHIQSYIENIFLEQKSLAIMLSSQEDLASSEAQYLLCRQATLSGASDMYIYTPDGKFLFMDESSLPISQHIDYSESLKGNTYVSDISNTDNHRRLVAFTVPISKGRRVIGVLVCVCSDKRLACTLDRPFYSGQGYIHIFQSDGSFVMRHRKAISPLSAANSYFAIQQLEFSEGSFEKMVKDIRHRKGGFVAYTNFADSQQYAFYTPVGVKDWYVVAIIPQKVMDHYSMQADAVIMSLTAKIFLAFLILLLFVALDSRRRHKNLQEANNQLELSDQRFRIAVSHLTHLMFEYDFGAKKVKILNNLLPSDNLFHEFDKLDDFDGIISHRYIYPDDMTSTMEMFEQISSGGKRSASCVMRIYLSEEKTFYRWFRLSVTGVYDDSNTAVKAVGTLEDIDDQKNKEQSLLEIAVQDPLTGLLNRMECANRINALLAHQKSDIIHALLLLDLDDFKGINDQYGHIMGDNVLQSLGKALKKAFRSTDIIARLGGDEFIVFLVDISNTTFIESKCRMLSEALQEEEIHVPISFSAGAAVASPGDDFTELYRRADVALYHSKSLGKCRVSVY